MKEIKRATDWLYSLGYRVVELTIQFNWSSVIKIVSNWFNSILVRLRWIIENQWFTCLIRLNSWLFLFKQIYRRSWILNQGNNPNMATRNKTLIFIQIRNSYTRFKAAGTDENQNLLVKINITSLPPKWYLFKTDRFNYQWLDEYLIWFIPSFSINDKTMNSDSNSLIKLYWLHSINKWSLHRLCLNWLRHDINECSFTHTSIIIIASFVMLQGGYFKWNRWTNSKHKSKQYPIS